MAAIAQVTQAWPAGYAGYDLTVVYSRRRPGHGQGEEPVLRCARTLWLPGGRQQNAAPVVSFCAPALNWTEAAVTVQIGYWQPWDAELLSLSVREDRRLRIGHGGCSGGLIDHVRCVRRSPAERS